MRDFRPLIFTLINHIWVGDLAAGKKIIYFEDWGWYSPFYIFCVLSVHYKIFYACWACGKNCLARAHSALKSHNFSNFVKQTKDTQRVQILDNRFGDLQMGWKTIFIFDLALNCSLSMQKLKVFAEQTSKSWPKRKCLSQHFIQHCYICRSSDSTVSEDDGIELRTVATSAYRLSDALATRRDLIHQF